MNQAEMIKLRAKAVRKLSDSEIHKEMADIVLQVAENAKRRKSKSRRQRFETLWAEHAMLEHIADNEREDVPVEDAVDFFNKSRLFIGTCLNNGKASDQFMTIHNDL